MNTDRRTVLMGGAAGLAVAALPAVARAQGAAARNGAGQNGSGQNGSGQNGSGPLAPIFDDLVQAQLRRGPEGATNLGLDTGANADLRSKLSDQSLAAVRANKANNLAELKRLEAVDASKLTADQRIDLECVLYTRRSAARVGAFDFGGSGYGPSPYVISQQSGAYQSTPDFLDTKHRIETKGDADAYLKRVSAFARQIDDQTERMRRDVGNKVVPPDFILDLALTQMEKLRVPAGQALVVRSLARRTVFSQQTVFEGAGAGYVAQATKLWEGEVLPALDRQIAYAREVRRTATHDAGVWKLPEGAGFYPAALQANTTTSLSPEEVHRFGLDQAKALSARLDGELKKLGYGQGTVGQRMRALGQDPKQLYPNTDEGRMQAIAYCNARLAAIKGRLPAVFERMPPYAFEVRRVPPQTEAGAAGAFAQAPSLDGSRPGLVYFNLRDTADWPKFALATTTYHEGLPGHQMESGLALSNTGLPLIRKISGFSGYGEGWALYSEQLSDEIGMYDDDPIGRCGYLVAQLFRANRCVVDTGLHHYRWSREKAIAYFMDAQGDPEGDATREIERYCVNPGQAASYKLGHSVFVDIRDKAKRDMGAKFDLKGYHTAVLRYGRVPLDVLKRIGDDWIAGKA